METSIYIQPINESYLYMKYTNSMHSLCTLCLYVFIIVSHLKSFVKQTFTRGSYVFIIGYIQITHLGVHVTDSLKFSSHISKIAAKANSTLGRIYSLFINKEITKLLYHLWYVHISSMQYNAGLRITKKTYFRTGTKKSH